MYARASCSEHAMTWKGQHYEYGPLRHHDYATALKVGRERHCDCVKALTMGKE